MELIDIPFSKDLEVSINCFDGGCVIGINTTSTMIDHTNLGFILGNMLFHKRINKNENIYIAHNILRSCLESTFKVSIHSDITMKALDSGIYPFIEHVVESCSELERVESIKHTESWKALVNKAVEVSVPGDLNRIEGHLYDISESGIHLREFKTPIIGIIRRQI